MHVLLSRLNDITPSVRESIEFHRSRGKSRVFSHHGSVYEIIVDGSFVILVKDNKEWAMVNSTFLELLAQALEYDIKSGGQLHEVFLSRF